MPVTSTVVGDHTWSMIVRSGAWYTGGGEPDNAGRTAGSAAGCGRKKDAIGVETTDFATAEPPALRRTQEGMGMSVQNRQWSSARCECESAGSELGPCSAAQW